MAHAFCVLDNKVYKETLRIFNTYCLSTATTVSLTHLNIKFYTLFFILVVLIES